MGNIGTKRQKTPNQRIQWNKKGSFNQGIKIRVYGAITIIELFFCSTDSNRSISKIHPSIQTKDNA
jgi:hypothetical protein